MDALNPEPRTLTPIQERILAWYGEHGRDLPWRRTRDPYHILVAEVMLQQTQVERVLPKYHQWLEAFPTLQALAGAPTADVIRLWTPLGYNGRAIRLKRVAGQCVEQFGGQMPASFEELRELAGVGRYTAGAIACFAYEQQVAFWDTNVRRVLSRLFRGHDAELPERDLEALAAEALPAGQAYDWHQALMDLGATICPARNPRCDLCPAVDLCAAHPAVLFAQPRIAERKAKYQAQRFETTNRYFRGRIVDALREHSPLSTADLTLKLGRDDPDWLQGLVAGLERDGLLVRQGNCVSLP
ncbi:MAG TPA: A/G-specific adenine glycosylase [Chloroflexota bacterium]|nr:A/G-specific adenine glycosylase [Chloroflexota bacterium]